MKTPEQNQAKRSSDNRRRLDRLPVSLDATLDTPEGESISGTISDFCRAGVYFRFARQNRPGRQLPPLPGSDTQISFSTGRGKQARRYALTCRVAHISETGIGLFIPSMPLACYQALGRDHAATNTARAIPAGEADFDLLRQCHERTRAAIPDLLQDVFARLDTFLSGARLEISFMEHARYDHAEQIFKTRRPSIEAHFMAQLGATLLAIEEGREPTETEAREVEELSLVEDVQFEDWLARTTVTTQVEARLDQDLGLLHIGYGSAAGVALSRKFLPFGPETLSRCFGHAIAELDIQPDIRQLAYKALSATLRIKLPALYNDLAKILAPLHAVPSKRIIHKYATPATASQAPTEPNRGQATHVASSDASTRTQDLPEINHLLEKLIGDTSPGKIGALPGQDGQEVIPYNLGNILMALNQPSAQNRLAGEPTRTRAAAPDRLPMEPAASELWPSQSNYANLIQVAQEVHSAFRQLASHPERPAPSGDASAGSRAYSGPPPTQHDLLAALDRLPANTPGDAGKAPVPLALRLNSHLGRVLPAPLPPQEKNALDTIVRILDMAGAEQPVTSQIEALLRALERPLLKLSITDADFLTAPHHQAKRMVSLLDQYAIAANDLGQFFDPKLQQFLSTLLERVVSRADTDPTIFAKANGYLERMLTPIQAARRRRIALLQETCEGKERVRSARNRTNDMLEQLLGNRAVPVLLIHLLDLGWRHYLVLMELRQGINHPDWHRGKAALSLLLDWLGSPAGSDLPSARSSAELLTYIEQHLATVNVETTRVESLIETLADALADLRLGKAAKMVRVPNGRFQSKTLPSVAETTAFLDDLRIGTWWRFDQDGQTRPMQLIWLSQPPGLCAFSNRSATQKLELSLAELEHRCATGTALPSDSRDLPLIERTAQVIIDDAYTQLSHEVSHDPVTGLINRKGFMQKLQQLAALRDDQTHYVCILEFDQFRVIYNNCGVEAGEDLSRKLSAELAAQVGSDDIVAAFQDDLFALLIYRRNRIQILEFAGKLLKVFQNFRFDHGQERYSIGVNIGLAEYVSMHDSPEEVLKNADSACINARKAGRNRLQRFDPSNEQLRMQQFLMDLAGRIDQIVQEHGLYLRCQRVVPLDADAGLAPYHEILLGIRDRNEDIRPMKFLSAVERWQRGHEIDMWVIENTFAWIETHLAQFERSAGFAINLSPSSLASGDFQAYLHGKLDNAGFSLDKLAFEIAETSTLDTYRAAQEFIRLIRRFGCKCALDDVGSGFSSFAHLKNLRTDVLKIDGIFVKDCVNNPADLAMVNSMNEIGHALGMKTVAEYVESEEILEKLRTIGVDYVQGYALHKPIPLDQLVLDADPPEVAKVLPPMAARNTAFPTQLSETAARRHTWRNPNSGGLGKP